MSTMPGVVERGVVEAFDGHVGLGTVRADSGAVHPFHCTAITDGSRSIDPGQLVVLEVGPAGPGRWEATMIMPLAGTDAIEP